jgi:hypothetical protein
MFNTLNGFDHALFLPNDLQSAIGSLALLDGNAGGFKLSEVLKKEVKLIGVSKEDYNKHKALKNPKEWEVDAPRVIGKTLRNGQVQEITKVIQIRSKKGEGQKIDLFKIKQTSEENNYYTVEGLKADKSRVHQSSNFFAQGSLDQTKSIFFIPKTNNVFSVGEFVLDVSGPNVLTTQDGLRFVGVMEVPTSIFIHNTLDYNNNTPSFSFKGRAEFFQEPCTMLCSYVVPNKGIIHLTKTLEDNKKSVSLIDIIKGQEEEVGTLSYDQYPYFLIKPTRDEGIAYFLTLLAFSLLDPATSAHQTEISSSMAKNVLRQFIKTLLVKESGESDDHFKARKQTYKMHTIHRTTTEAHGSPWKKAYEKYAQSRISQGASLDEIKKELHT